MLGDALLQIGRESERIEPAGWRRLLQESGDLP
jgi:hypothetical protein